MKLVPKVAQVPKLRFPARSPAPTARSNAAQGNALGIDAPQPGALKGRPNSRRVEVSA